MYRVSQPDCVFRLLNCIRGRIHCLRKGIDSATLLPAGSESAASCSNCLLEKHQQATPGRSMKYNERFCIPEKDDDIGHGLMIVKSNSLIDRLKKR